MKNCPKISKKVEVKSVVLCETTNKTVSNRTTTLLIRDAIPFSSVWKHVPFFRRSAYNGASQVCVISINRNEYGKARRSLDTLDSRDRDRILLNVI